MNQSLPTRVFREHTDLDQLKRQAKELLEAIRGGDATAMAEVNAHYRGADTATFRTRTPSSTRETATIA